MTVGENIKRIRNERGITQKRLGELCGMNEVQIRQYELGKANPKIETVEKIASALQVTAFDLRGVDYWDEKYNPNGKLADEVKSRESLESCFGKKATEILNDFTTLNEQGQEKAIDYVSDLAEQPKYQKDPEK